MPAPAEGAVDIDAVGLLDAVAQQQRIDRLVQQHGRVGKDGGIGSHGLAGCGARVRS
ncbi:hypothetical protein [Piscinibacter sakaiensis]|uniref:hypothetical protein n=1 Tax=Piscinibacter sakaiensis TaxID=1547922 RepID=UPI003AAFA8C3